MVHLLPIKRRPCVGRYAIGFWNMMLLLAIVIVETNYYAPELINHQSNLHRELSKLFTCITSVWTHHLSVWNMDIHVEK